VVALGVMLVLSFLGALFVAIVGNALENSRQSNRTGSADTFAQAGIDYADKMLQTSPEGADWRPPLQYVYYAATGSYTFTDASGSVDHCPFNNESQCFAYDAMAAQLSSADNKDPDKLWLQQGYSRYNVGNGRFLIRLSYVSEPGAGGVTTNAAQNILPTSKYIKIESIGLEGTVTPSDPTSYLQVDNKRRSEIVAYKPITLGDYTLFVTDKDKRGEVASLGLPATIPSTANPQSLITTGIDSFTGTWDSTNLASAGLVTPTFLTTMFGSNNEYFSTASVAGAGSGGGSIRVNSDLRLYGPVQVYANPVLGEGIQVAGRLLFDGFSAGSTGQTTVSGASRPFASEQPTQLQVVAYNSGSAAISTGLLFPTNASDSSGNNIFSTFGGLVRDNSGSSDAALYPDGNGSTAVTGSGYPRSAKRLEPPIIDRADPKSRLTRYQTIARTGTGSSAAASPSGGTVGSAPGNSGPYSATGNVASVYVDNSTDIQAESEQFSLRDQWINKADPQSSGYWRGSVYNPPGVDVIFSKVAGTTLWGFTITRAASSQQGIARWTWRNADGSTGVRYCHRMRFVYGAPPSAGDAQNDSDPIFYLGNADNAPLTNSSTNVPDNQNNDIVIYAEGNVRVRGMISNPAGSTDHHVTVVSNGIVYIDGSILKGHYSSAASSEYSAAASFSDGNDVPTLNPVYYGTEPNTSQTTARIQDPTDPTQYSKSSIALLAKQYVTVNTTQFTPGAEDFQYNQVGPNAPPSLGEDGYEFAQGQSLNMAYLYPKLYAMTSGSSVLSGYMYQGSEKLYMSASGDSGTAYADVSFIDPDWNYTDTSAGTAALTNLYPSNSATSGYPLAVGANIGRNAVTTIPYNFYSLGLVDPLILQISADPMLSAANLIVHRAAILPGDIRIEAMMYAQNNSFFIIPGDWFNPHDQDTVRNAVSREKTTTDSEFPFSGQPIDLKITIFGSIVENRTASIADQAAWALKWGWIPKYHGSFTYDSSSVSGVSPHYVNDGDIASLWQKPDGSTATVSNFITAGLTYQYDPMVGFPVTGLQPNCASSQAPAYIRVDKYGRSLPFAPSLPVSPDLIYSGAQSTTASVLNQ
jgi:hypothetical protein